MAKKKKDSKEENMDNQEEFNDIDENFGLPDVELNPLDESEEEAAPEEEPVSEEPAEEQSWSNEEEETSTEETDYSDQPESSYDENVDDEDTFSKPESTYVPGSYAEPQSNKAPGIIAIVVIVILALGAGWYFLSYKPEQEAKEKARTEKLAKQKAAAEKKQKYDGLIAKGDGEFGNEEWESAKSSYNEALALFPKEQYPKEQVQTIDAKLAEIAEANKVPDVGTVETISAATGRYYVVVSSSIDGDLAMDYSNKAIKEGANIKIIAPYADKKFYRVTIGDYDTWADAESAIGSLSATFGNELWILKY